MWAWHLPKSARTMPLFSRSFLEFFGAANKKGRFLTQEGAAPLSSSRKESRK
jgi:hypothetical protein